MDSPLRGAHFSSRSIDVDQDQTFEDAFELHSITILFPSIHIS